jgi:hypothetical protein
MVLSQACAHVFLKDPYVFGHLILHARPFFTFYFLLFFFNLILKH